MRTTLTCLAVLLSCAVIGCDSQQAQISEAQQKLDRALAAFNIAQQGYAPVKNSRPQNLQAFRQEQLDAIVDDLQSVIANGSTQQQQTASRLLASVHLSAARYATRSALSQFASLSARLPVLEGALYAAERSSAQVQASDTDYDAVLAQLAADSSGLQKRHAELTQQAQTLQQQIADEKTQQQQLIAQSQADAASARQAMDAAFIAEGDDQVAQYNAADAATRKAGQASAAADKHQVQIDLLNRRLAIVQTQLDTLSAQIADLKAQADQTRKLQTDSQAFVTAAEGILTEQSAALKAEFDARASDFESVSSLLESAASRSAEAADRLAAADTAEQLGARLDQAYINTERALVAATWAAVVDMIATISEQVELPEAGQYRAAHKDAQAQHADAVKAAQAAIDAGRTLAEAASDAAALDAYAQRLGAPENQPAPPPPAEES